MKDIILENLSMIDILDKYNIKRKGNQFVCPFHGDNHPSAKAYKNSYFCFACGKTGDLIQFVEDYFNLDFKGAMQNLNHDFNLGLSFKTNKHQIKSIQLAKKAKQEREKRAKEQNEKIILICDRIKDLKDNYNYLKSQLTPYNWEYVEKKCSEILQQIEILDWEFEELYIKKI